MPRSTNQILLQLERQLPDWARPLRPHLAGIAAMLAHAEAKGAVFADASTVAGADGIWLTLLARGYGVSRALEESDAALRRRLRAPERQLTRTAILAAVDALLAEYTDAPAVMIEPWDEGYYNREFYLDRRVWSGEPLTFLLVVPLVATSSAAYTYLDAGYFDRDLYLGAEGDDALTTALRAVVNRLRAAGIRWRLVVDVEGLYTAPT